jgi:hypothetical protein
MSNVFVFFPPRIIEVDVQDREMDKTLVEDISTTATKTYVEKVPVCILGDETSYKDAQKVMMHYKGVERLHPPQKI